MTDSFGSTHGPVTSEMLVRLATLLNDFNPAHYDLSFAQSVGLPGVIGPGTLIQGWLLADVQSRCGRDGEPNVLRDIDLRLRSPFLVGDTVEIRYEVDGGVVAAEVTARTPGADDSRVVATASMTLHPAGRP